MTDLVEFIEARLAEDEAVARSIRSSWRCLSGTGEIVASDGAAAEVCAVAHWEGVGEHIARHDPARVLREVEAKRDIVGEHRTGRYGECDRCREPGLDRNQSAACRTLRLLAAPYADHPDYRSEWSPAS